MAVKIKDERKKFDALQKMLKTTKKNKPHVAVGIHQAEGSQPKEEDSPFTLADVASANEFGTQNESGTEIIPSRSFLRSTYDENQGRFFALLRRYRNELLTDKKTMFQVLSFVGQFAQKQVVLKIVAGGTPFTPNAPRTEQAKGSTSPLIDTGQMRQSIRYEVRNAK